MRIEYPPKPYAKLTRKQLLTLAIALEDQRDRAIAKAERAEALLGELVDDAQCEYDSQGYCKTHDAYGGSCPHDRAKDLLAAIYLRDNHPEENHPHDR